MVNNYCFCFYWLSWQRILEGIDLNLIFNLPWTFRKRWQSYGDVYLTIYIYSLYFYYFGDNNMKIKTITNKKNIFLIHLLIMFSILSFQIVLASPSTPDLIATKTNDVNGSVTIGNSFNWTIKVSNTGNKDTTPGNNTVLLKDELPISGAIYGSPSITASSSVENPNNISCIILNNVLTCTTISGDVKMKNPSGYFSVTFSVTPTTSGTLTNPKNSGVCKTDPNNTISESNENNNNCSDSVTVNPGTASLTVTKIINNNNSTLSCYFTRNILCHFYRIINIDKFFFNNTIQFLSHMHFIRIFFIP